MSHRTIDEIVKQEVAKSKVHGDFKPMSKVVLIAIGVISCLIFQLCWRGF